MTYTSWSSGFMLHLEDNLMYDYHSLGFSPVILSYISNYLLSYLHIMTQCDPNFDLKVNINGHDLSFIIVSIMNQCDLRLTSQVYVGQ